MGQGGKNESVNHRMERVLSVGHKERERIFIDICRRDRACKSLLVMVKDEEVSSTRRVVVDWRRKNEGCEWFV